LEKKKMRIGVWGTDKSQPYVKNFGRLDIWQIICMLISCGVIAGNGYVYGIEDDVIRFGFAFMLMVFFLRNMLLDMVLLGAWGYFVSYRFILYYAGKGIPEWALLGTAAVPFVIWLVSQFIGKRKPWRYERWLAYSMLGLFAVKLVISG
jgi:phage shock protein PspC (stress-responsive transcriptional regulator)